jgi:hypothetical protein
MDGFTYENTTGGWHMCNECGARVSDTEKHRASHAANRRHKWLFGHRRREAQAAWRRYVENGAAGPDADPDTMPVLFEAGFHMGVGAAQREADQ